MESEITLLLKILSTAVMTEDYPPNEIASDQDFITNYFEYNYMEMLNS